MEIAPTALPGVLLIKPKVWSDARGFFLESWNESTFEQAGLNVHFRQDNHSRSVRNVVRGLHYQLNPPQGKLVRCTRGAIFDVAVDLRRSSPTFGAWMAVELSETNHQMLWIPPGFAHGFFALSDEADVHYKASELVRRRLGPGGALERSTACRSNGRLPELPFFPSRMLAAPPCWQRGAI